MQIACSEWCAMTEYLLHEQSKPDSEAEKSIQVAARTFEDLAAQRQHPRLVLEQQRQTVPAASHSGMENAHAVSGRSTPAKAMSHIITDEAGAAIDGGAKQDVSIRFSIYKSFKRCIISLGHP